MLSKIERIDPKGREGLRIGTNYLLENGYTVFVGYSENQDLIVVGDQIEMDDGAREVKLKFLRRNQEIDQCTIQRRCVQQLS